MGNILYSVAKKCEHPTNFIWQILQIPFAFSMRIYGKMAIKEVRDKSIREKGELSNSPMRYMFLASSDVGDVLFFRSSLTQCLKLHGLVNDDMVFIGNKLTCKAAQAVGIPNTYALPQHKLSALSMEYHCNYRKYNDFHFFYPWCFFDYENATDKWQPDTDIFVCDRKHVEESMKKANLSQGKTVILSPYQNAFASEGEKDLPFVFWELLVKSLQTKGYTVCTNCSGKGKELPIPGTEVFFPHLSDCCSSVDYAGYAVAIRSGFVDFIKDTQGKLVVLYPSEQYHDMWSVNKKKEKANCIELVCDTHKTTQIDIQDLVNRIIGIIED